eukprot:s5207_g1.t1
MALRPQAKWSSSHPKAAPAGRVEMEIEEISSEEGAAEAPHRIGSNSLRLTPEQQSLVLGYDWDPPYLSGPNQWQGSLPLRHNQRGCQYCLLRDKVCTEGHIMSLARHVSAGDDVHLMLALRRLVEGRRHLDVKIAYKINGGSQHSQYGCPVSVLVEMQARGTGAALSVSDRPVPRLAGEHVYTVYEQAGNRQYCSIDLHLLQAAARPVHNQSERAVNLVMTHRLRPGLPGETLSAIGVPCHVAADQVMSSMYEVRAARTRQELRALQQRVLRQSASWPTLGARPSSVGGASTCFRGGVGYVDGLHLSPDAMPHLVEMLEPFLEDVQPRVACTPSTPDSVASRGRRRCGVQRLRPVL